MEHLHNQEEEIEAIINSLNHISRAEAPPFFYTRLHARLHEEVKPTQLQQLIGILTRPAFVVATLSFFVVLNGIAISSVLKESKVITESNTGNDGTIQSFAREFDLSVSTLYSDTKTNE